jgi:hypothetical protein
MMIAIYRIAVQGWSKADAIDEMTKGDFGFHPMRKNLITFIEKLDVATLKRRAALHYTPIDAGTKKAGLSRAPPFR